MKTTFLHRGKRHELEIHPSGEDFLIRLNGQEHVARLDEAADGRQILWLDGQRIPVVAALDGETAWVACGGKVYALQRETRSARRAAGGEPDSESVLHAPMPGTVRAVQVAAGENVARGQTLLLLEAMKMEIRIQAPAEGRVKTLHVEPGQQVEKDQRLVEME